jgi:hypothetical protein
MAGVVVSGGGLGASASLSELVFRVRDYAPIFHFLFQPKQNHHDGLSPLSLRSLEPLLLRFVASSSFHVASSGVPIRGASPSARREISGQPTRSGHERFH